ncbi:mannosyl (alpha-1,6-)-glycoprotein beta-1,6-N-acetyl-glucosaminyltransferase [Parelaphostrongylus tenuis]|uniref:alpha-1,6-mannosyl-glycoprotein 6-beta-N-acetylglucosaminyltransferase n=1 Tax=Parelaphostrongylus tenuis TaxID=148309 RepID=A0AAD5N2K8_PARTN|nr:mannosyl (alpha-1,6-)-glycoprotein beta-1,6-N-acetyl-glucosaminyltransferase [Parelaphostrongylus tenuis]
MRKQLWTPLILVVFFTISLIYLHSRLGAEVSRRELLSYYKDGASFRVYSNTSLSCMQFPKDMSLYPKCYEKMIWMFSGWKTHKCYADYGIDGTLCSFRRYLSLVENHCPPLPFESVSYRLVEAAQIAEPSTDLQKLLNTLGQMKFSYMKDRLNSTLVKLD